MALENPQVNVHCLVHPGFDLQEHPEFEAAVHAYIQHFAQKTKDVLLIVSDGEVFDNEQFYQFSLLNIIEGIIYYFSLKSFFFRDSFPVYINDAYNPLLISEGLTEKLYRWCQENIDTLQLDEIEDAWKQLNGDYSKGLYADNMEEHNNKAEKLRNTEKELRKKLDISGYAQKALEEVGPSSSRRITQRNMQNSGRFFRIYQHAMKAFGKERMREIFIADGETEDTVSIQPISHFREPEGRLIPTPFGEEVGNTQVFNASEESTYGNAAKLRDELTYKLSVSRNQKLVTQNLKKLLEDMGVGVIKNINFIFLGEYRDRCVDNVAHILHHRLAPLVDEKFYIADDRLTLERPANYISRSYF